MEGAIDCKSYQFLDARDRDGGRKSLLRGLAKVPHTHIYTHTYLFILILVFKLLCTSINK